jgi:sterol desaturase/sphingolipid hydroxylase (fatty acid hydroxylase superfamily)
VSIDMIAWPIVAIGGLFLILLLAETLWPFAPRDWRRWPVNLGLGALSLVLARLLGFVGPLAVAIWAERAGFGLLNWADVPLIPAIVASVVAMDFAVWAQHRQMHHTGWLWRWHRLHHADPTIDLSTGVRFHPLEAVVSLAWKSLCTALFGVPPVAVPVFELWLTGGSLIEHANLRLPDTLERAVRRLWVTPGMHRIHHSAHVDDALHNFGFAFSVWDRIFGTYRAAASGPMIGLPAPGR